MKKHTLLFLLLLPHLWLPSIAAQEKAFESALLFEAQGVLRQPQVALGDAGDLALVCVGAKGKVYVALRERDGSWSELRMLDTEPDLAFGMRRGPRIAWAKQALLVSYICARYDREQRQVVGSGDLLLRRSEDRGASWSKALTINGLSGSAAEGLHAMSARGDDALLIWLDPRGEPKGMKIFAATSQDGGKSMGAERTIYVSPSQTICECCHPSLAMSTNGDATVLWRNHIAGFRDMFVGTLKRDASAVENPRACGTSTWQLSACPMDGGGIALLADQRPLSVWRREDEIYFSVDSAHEQRLGAGRNAVVATHGDVARVVWEREGELVTTRIEPAAIASTPVIESLGPGSSAVIVALPDGTFLVLAERGREAGLKLWQLPG